MPKLIFNDNESIEDVAIDTPIKDVCEKNGIPFACEEGICGTCIVEVEEGGENLSKMTQEEIDFLGEDEEVERLACQCKIKNGNVKIRF